MSNISAFFVENQTVDRVISWLSDTIAQDDYWHDEFSRQFHELGIDHSTDDWRTALGKAMLSLNVRALEQRYSDQDTTKLMASALRYHYRHQDIEPIQALKSLDCWLYQCTEGDIPETRMYQFFKTKVMLAMTTSYMHGLSAYDAAEWG